MGPAGARIAKKGKSSPRFDVDELRELAGEKVFARGAAYERDGLVEILALDETRVLAEVAGTEDYRTELVGRGRDIEGECSCPAFGDWGFCKHMVATALAANAAGDEACDTDVIGRIREYLRSKGADALANMIVDLAQQDLVLFRRLDLAAVAVGADDKTLEARLQKQIDTATRADHHLDYEEAEEWVAGVTAALDSIAGLVSAPRAGLALKLAERAIERIWGALEDIADPEGECRALIERASTIHLQAARVSKPDPVGLARELFTREMNDDLGVFRRTAEAYADVLGDKGLAELRRLAVEAWAKLPPLNGRAGRSVERPQGYGPLKRMLDFFAEREGDVARRIELRAMDLSSPWNYLQLAEFCLANGRTEEALRRAEEGLWMFEDGRPDERLVLFTADLLAKCRRKADASGHLWRAFEKSPSLELYARLRKLDGKGVAERAIKSLESGLGAQDHQLWNSRAGLVIRIMLQEKMIDAAWAVVGKHSVPMEAKEKLAQSSEASHRKEALAVYDEQVAYFAATGAYHAAAKLVAHMATLQSPAERAQYMTALKARDGRKRNFMKLLG